MLHVQDDQTQAREAQPAPASHEQPGVGRDGRREQERGGGG